MRKPISSNDRPTGPPAARRVLDENRTDGNAVRRGISLGERTFEGVGDLANDAVEARTPVRAHVQNEPR